MDPKWHYDSLIETRKGRKREVGKYYEKHHIVPRSLNGSDSDENLVYLTAREHFLAHWLLWKIHRNRSTAFAFFAMCSWKGENSKRKRISSREYQEAREAISKTVGKRSDETKRKCSESRTAHEVRWLMTLSQEEAEKRIERYHQRLSNGVKKYHDERDKTVSRYTDEGRSRLNKTKLGIHLTDEHKEKLRIKSQRKGRNVRKVSCPHCGKEGGGGNMTRYHFDNCKHGKEYSVVER